ncbi:MAG: hypothetical protein LKJ25_06490 [Clostridia bacterium]|jgi:hypothetical protein|nr:hypothetical protein [Clostridia bacterium]
MLKGIMNLSTVDVIYAALLAFVITQIILGFNRIRKSLRQMSQSEPKRMPTEKERMDIIAKCKAMFPVGTICFRGKIFTSGMIVRITTLQKRIIEGEIIGKNDHEVLCIITREHIIAHEIGKIEDMTELAKDVK